MNIKIAGLIALGLGAAGSATAVYGVMDAKETIECVRIFYESYTTDMIERFCGTDQLDAGKQALEIFKVVEVYANHVMAGGFLAFLFGWHKEKSKE